VVASLKGYDAVTRYGEQYKNNISRNVIAKIEGTDPSLKAQYVITGGHLDHTASPTASSSTAPTTMPQAPRP